MRGLDLSGSVQGAGGVGGVLAVSLATNGTHFAAFDGNGNMMALVSAASGAETARYDYDPFGQTIRTTGPMASLSSLRFSTQLADERTRHVKYLFRDYEANHGKWLNRDPFLETAFDTALGNNAFRPDISRDLNESQFVGNVPVSEIDYLGLRLCYCNLQIDPRMVSGEDTMDSDQGRVTCSKSNLGASVTVTHSHISCTESHWYSLYFCNCDFRYCEAAVTWTCADIKPKGGSKFRWKYTSWKLTKDCE
jgi:RHS repeat-associated protein